MVDVGPNGDSQCSSGYGSNQGTEGNSMWTTPSLEDPLQLPDINEKEHGNLLSLFSNDNERAKDLGFTTSENEFISLDGLDDRNRNAMVNIFHINNYFCKVIEIILFSANLQFSCDHIYSPTESTGFLGRPANATAGSASVSIATGKWHASTECSHQHSAISTSSSATTTTPRLPASTHVSPPATSQSTANVSALPISVSTFLIKILLLCYISKFCFLY